MGTRRWTRIVAGSAAIAVAFGLVALGRLTAADGDARADGDEAGKAAGYLSGLRAGRAEGVREGRAYQETSSLPPDSRRAARAAFQAGYAAGANDAFGDYDGGWYLARPYVITLAAGRGAITYRIESRTPIETGVDYYLCPHSQVLCQRPRG